LYDVTLYFEAEHEDALRKVGYSKERRAGPQIVVGLLVDRHGFPLEIGCYEGDKAEKHTILPVIRQFQARHGLEAMVVVADAGGGLGVLREAIRAGQQDPHRAGEPRPRRHQRREVRPHAPVR
jgi:hypothetical protein